MTNKLTIDLKETYLAMIKNSVGSKMFQNCFFRNKKGELVDVCDGGKFSCAFFVSSVLEKFNLIECGCVTVSRLEKLLKKAGWFIEKENQEFFWQFGSILVWEPKLALDGEKHPHTGFYIGNTRAVSNSPEFVPAEHHANYNGDRRILRVYCHPFLELG